MTKPSITKRSVKGAALTYTELDDNFQNLKDATVSLTADTGGTQVTSDLNGTITLVAGSGISLSGNNTSKEITITSTSASNTFSTIAVSGQSNVVADSTSDTLTLVAGSNVSITTDAASDSVTIAASVTGLTNPLNADLDLGSYKIKDTSGVATISTAGLKIESISGSDSIQIAPNGTGLYTIDCADNKDLTIRTFVSGVVGARITLDHDTGVNIGTGDVTRAVSLSDGALHLASMTTAQRATISPVNGMIIYNSSTNNLQGYVNGAWVNFGGSTAASDLTGTTLASGVTASSLTSVGTLTNLTVAGSATVVSGSATDKYINVGTHGQLFDDGNLHIHTNGGALWINSLDSSNIKIGTQYNSGSGSDIDIGKNLIANSGSVTANATAAFIAGSNAISNVSLQMPSESAIRNTTNGATNMYFDVGTGGTTTGTFQFRSGSGYTNFMTLDSSGPKAISAYKGKLGWNSAIDTELTVDDYRFRVSNQGGVFPQIISNTGGTKNTAWTAVGAISGAAIAQLGSTGVFVANNAWTTLYNSHGMDSAGDTVTVTLQDKAQGRIYRITFMRSDNGSTTGYNIIVERIL